MKTTHKALIWAGIIIATAYYTQYLDLSSGASMGITMGLVGAAWGTIQSGRGSCRKACG